MEKYAEFGAFQVKDTRFILKKFRNAVPSLIVHLHPTHFRFDQQDGSFSYNSPMKLILEHIRLSTVPHDMIEDFAAAGVKFYDGKPDTLWSRLSILTTVNRVLDCADPRP